MATEPETGATAPVRPAFVLELRSRSVLLTVDADGWTAGKANRNEICLAVGDFPVEVYSSDRVAEAIDHHDNTPIEIGRVEIPASVDDWEVKLAPSHMAAYVVPGAAANEAEGAGQAKTNVSSESIREELAELGVTTGILDEILEQIDRDGGVSEITAVARGVQPVRSTNARVETLFSKDAHVAPVERSDGSVDFHAVTGNLSVNEGDVLARRLPAVPGTPGLDVLGKAIPVQPPVDRLLGPMAGKGTEVRGDELIALKSGRPIFNGTKVEVLPVFDVKGDVNYAVGNIKFSGDVNIGGDVHPGFTIEAEGSVTIRGIVEHSSISAGKDVTVGGVVGDGHCSIQAGGDLRAQYIHKMNVTVGGEVVINRELVGCTVTARKVQTSPNGRIVGGEVVAREAVTAGILGSPQSVVTQVTVLENSEKSPAVVRVTRTVHAGTAVRLGHCSFKVVDDLGGSSFWIHEGDISRLGPAASPPKAA